MGKIRDWGFLIQNYGKMELRIFTEKVGISDLSYKIGTK